MVTICSLRMVSLESTSPSEKLETMRMISWDSTSPVCPVSANTSLLRTTGSFSRQLLNSSTQWWSSSNATSDIRWWVQITFSVLLMVPGMALNHSAYVSVFDPMLLYLLFSSCHMSRNRSFKRSGWSEYQPEQLDHLFRTKRQSFLYTSKPSWSCFISVFLPAVHIWSSRRRERLLALGTNSAVLLHRMSSSTDYARCCLCGRYNW